MKPKQVACITGGAQGIGSGLVQHFARAGYHVIFTDIDTERGSNREEELLQAGLKVSFFPCDLSSQSDVESLAKRLKPQFQHIDVMIFNARARAYEREIVNNLNEEWDTSMDVMLKHPIYLTELLFQQLKASDNASIIYIGSTNGSFISQQALSYHVVKGALPHLVKYLTCKYGEHQIRVNLLEPGIVDIPGRDKSADLAYQESLMSLIPLQRAASIEEIAESCLFLCSAGARYISGLRMNVDGGEHLKDHFDLVYHEKKKQREHV